MSVTIVDHPLAQIRLSIMRDEATRRPEFRRALHELSTFLMYEALRGLPLTTVDLDSPMGPTSGVVCPDPPVVVPVMRAGLGMLDAALDLLPDARVGFVGLKRNEETLLPHAYVNTVPDDLGGRPVIVLDPMLATGGSLIHTCQLLAESGAGPMTVVCALAAPEGIEAVTTLGLNLSLYTGSIDDRLNDVGFILPGLGDAGDRQFGLN